MTRPPDLYMIVRAADCRPDGVEYFAAGGGVSGPVTERGHAKLCSPADAQTLARVLNLFCAPDAWRGQWRAVPAEIQAPSPYQPQEKSADERSAAAAAALEAADREEREHLHAAVEGLEQPGTYWRAPRPVGW